jgi:hypothetical protein
MNWFVPVAPILLLPIVGLLRFVGCNQVFGLYDVSLRHTLSVNPTDIQLFPGQTQKLTAILDGLETSAVTWSVNSPDPAFGQVALTPLTRHPPALLTDSRHRCWRPAYLTTKRSQP